MQNERYNKRAATQQLLLVCYRLPHPTYLGPSSATRLLRRPPPNLHPSCACQGHTTLNQAPSRVARTLRESLDPAQPLQRCCNVREHAQTKRTRNNKNTDAVIGYTELKRSLRSLPVRAAIRSRLHVQSAAVVLQKRSPCPGHIHTAKQRDADVASESCVVKTRQAVVPVIDDVVCCVSAMQAHRRQVYSNEAERTPRRHRQGTTPERRVAAATRHSPTCTPTAASRSLAYGGRGQCSSAVPCVALLVCASANLADDDDLMIKPSPVHVSHHA